jgi:uncharacterized membrane protein
MINQATSKDDYLNRLKSQLSGLDYLVINDILRDQNEYFNDALAAGRSEAEILKGLGDPAHIAKELKLSYKIHAAQNEKRVWPQLNQVFHILLTICILAPLNFILLFIPFVLISVFIFCSSVTSFAFLVFSILGLILSFFVLPLSVYLFISGLFGSVSVGIFSLLILFGLYYFIKWLLKMTLSYLRWNIKIAKGEYK